MKFPIILWPPTVPFFDKIQSAISDNFHISFCKDYEIDDSEYKSFLDAIYKPDKTSPKRIKVKYKAQLSYPKKLRVIYIEIDNPTMLPHKKSRLKGKFYCQELKRFKRKIREQYAPLIKNYIYDVCIHIGDDASHTKRVKKIFNKYAISIKRIQYIEMLEKLDLPKKDFMIVGSAWLSLMGLKINEDLDVIIKKCLRPKFDNCIGLINLPSKKDKKLSLYPSYESSLEKLSRRKDSFKSSSLTARYVQIAGAKDEDDLIDNHSIEIYGYQFINIELLYKFKKSRNKDKDKKDIRLLRKCLSENGRWRKILNDPKI